MKKIKKEALRDIPKDIRKLLKKTNNQVKKDISNIYKKRDKSEREYLLEVYKIIKKENRQHVDIHLGFSWDDYSEDKALRFSVDSMNGFWGDLKSKRKIKDYSFGSEQFFDKELGSNSMATLTIQLYPDKFVRFCDKKFGTELKYDRKINLDISKFHGYLNKIPTAEQEIKLVELFFNKKPNEYVSSKEMIDFAGDIENLSVNGGKLIFKLKSILKNRKSIENKRGTGWKLKL